MRSALVHSVSRTAPPPIAAYMNVCRSMPRIRSPSSSLRVVGSSSSSITTNGPVLFVVVVDETDDDAVAACCVDETDDDAMAGCANNDDDDDAVRTPLAGDVKDVGEETDPVASGDDDVIVNDAVVAARLATDGDAKSDAATGAVNIAYAVHSRMICDAVRSMTGDVGVWRDERAGQVVPGARVR
jgi:hypothetical protein